MAPSWPDRADLGPSVVATFAVAMVNGVEMYVSAWVKESASGQKFFSLAFKNKDAGPQKDAPKQSDDLDEAIPF